jgi:hypothetical protein
MLRAFLWLVAFCGFAMDLVRRSWERPEPVDPHVFSRTISAPAIAVAVIANEFGDDFAAFTLLAGLLLAVLAHRFPGRHV